MATSKTRKKLNRIMAELDADMESFFGKENKDESTSTDTDANADGLPKRNHKKKIRYEED